MTLVQRGLDDPYITVDGRELYYSTVHNSWAVRWTEGTSEAFSANIPEDEAERLVLEIQAAELVEGIEEDLARDRPKHRNCKQRVDRIMALNPAYVGAPDVQILFHEIEDVRAERDDLLKLIEDSVDGWDELVMDEPIPQHFCDVMEKLRDLLPFPRRPRSDGGPRDRTGSRTYPSHGEVYDPRVDWPERYQDGPIS